MEDITIRIVRRARREEILRLYRSAGWWKREYDDSASAINAMVRGSFRFVGAFHEEKMIGMGRCISDGSSDAYIQDVTVLPEYRGRGVGKRIVLTLLKALRARGMEWIGLIAAPGGEKFYRSLGFKRFGRAVPMVWPGRK